MRLLADHDILGIHAVYVSSLTNVVAKAIENHVPNLTWPIVVKPSVLLKGGLNHNIIHSVVTWLRDTLLDHNHQEPFSDSLLLIVGRVTFIAGGYFDVMGNLINNVVEGTFDKNEILEIPTIKQAIW